MVSTMLQRVKSNTLLSYEYDECKIPRNVSNLNTEYHLL